VTYTYDTLNRLIAAVTTDSTWGQAFTYDGFGNRTSATQIKGAAPMGTWSYDANNHLLGYGWDANGNMTSSPGGAMTYDVDNRVTSAGGDQYAYAPDNKRIWKKLPSGAEEIYLYGISGQKLGTYGVSHYSTTPYFAIGRTDTNVYFGSRLIVSRATSVVQDRLGSNRAGGLRYFPYGEEQPTTTAQDRDKFGSYYRDGTTGLDYAQNRYYASTLGRFTSPDPFKASGGPADPQSWNQYAYTRGDPANRVDPHGLYDCYWEGSDCGEEQSPILDGGGIPGCPSGGPFLPFGCPQPPAPTPAPTQTPTPAPPTCEVDLMYHGTPFRASPFNHSYLLVKGVALAGLGSQFVLEGQPQNIPPIAKLIPSIVPGGPTALMLDFGKLMIQATANGFNDNIQKDTKSSVAIGSWVCDSIQKMLAAMNDYMKHPVDYGTVTTNSNAAAAFLLNAGGFSFPAPPLAPGWGYALP
jgi:RHS repeat-associated protein